MTGSEHEVDPADEGPHASGPERLWQESWYLDFAARDGSLGGYFRLGRYPNLGCAWWTAAIVVPGHDPVMSIDYTLPLTDVTRSVAVDATDLHATIATTSALQRSSVSCAATGRRVAAARLLEPGGYDDGEPVGVEVDLTWDTVGVPFGYGITTRYEIPGRVTGSVTIDGETHRVDAPGQRDHSWGERDWWAFGWCWLAAQLDDGTALHLTHVRLAPDAATTIGYVQSGVPPTLHAVYEGHVTETDGADGLPVAATAGFGEHAVDLHITPLLYAPLVLTDSGRTARFPRALAEFELGDGRSGVGWIEWNRPVVAAP